jgi:hypothetical protein
MEVRFKIFLAFSEGRFEFVFGRVSDCGRMFWGEKRGESNIVVPQYSRNTTPSPPRREF